MMPVPQPTSSAAPDRSPMSRARISKTATGYGGRVWYTAATLGSWKTDPYLGPRNDGFGTTRARLLSHISASRLTSAHQGIEGGLPILYHRRGGDPADRRALPLRRHARSNPGRLGHDRAEGAPGDRLRPHRRRVVRDAHASPPGARAPRRPLPPRWLQRWLE